MRVGDVYYHKREGKYYLILLIILTIICTLGLLIIIVVLWFRVPFNPIHTSLLLILFFIITHTIKVKQTKNAFFRQP